jgi:ATP-dependent DNA helicase Rep
MPTTKNTKPTAWWHAFSLCALAPPPLLAACNTATTKSLLFCTVPITWPSRLKKLCDARKFLTRYRADKVFLTAQKSKICVRGFACGVNNDDDPAFLRAVTSPKRGIGHQTLAGLGTLASQYKFSLFEALFSNSLGAKLSARAVGSLHEFGRFMNDLEYRAKRTHGAEDAKVFLLQWLKDIGYEKHLYDGEDNEKVAAARWTNVLEFVDWMSGRCGGTVDDAAGVSVMAETKSLLEVAQTISLLSTLNEREQDPNVVTLSTLHAAKGLEWPHVMLVGVNEGLLPFKMDEDNKESINAAVHAEGQLTRLQEERRLMYVGITRAQRTLAVSWTKRRKKGRETIAALPSRFIAEMALDKNTVKEDPREKLRALRAEFALKAAASEALSKG